MFLSTVNSFGGLCCVVLIVNCIDIILNCVVLIVNCVVLIVNYAVLGVNCAIEDPWSIDWISSCFLWTWRRFMYLCRQFPIRAFLHPAVTKRFCQELRVWTTRLKSEPGDHMTHPFVVDWFILYHRKTKSNMWPIKAWKPELCFIFSCIWTHFSSIKESNMNDRSSIMAQSSGGSSDSQQRRGVKVKQQNIRDTSSVSHQSYCHFSFQIH